MLDDDKYTYDLVEQILRHWEEIESLKEKTTAVPVPTYSIVDNSDWKMQEGNTLQQTGSRTTRIPSNSNKLVETLCVWCSDIEAAIGRMLSREEYDALMDYITLDEHEYTLMTKQSATESIGKIVQYLNR